MAGQQKNTPCSRSSQIEACFDHRLTPAARAELEEHLQTCSACQGELADLQRVRDTLRTEALRPAPVIDKVELAKRLFAEERDLAPGWPGRIWLGALGAAAAAAIVLIGLWAWPDGTPSLEPPAGQETAQPKERVAVQQPTAAPQTQRPVQVIFASGEIQGPVEQGGTWSATLGTTLSVGTDGTLALRLDEHCRIALLDAGRVHLARPDGWALRLEQGRVAVRLDPGRTRAFRIETEEGWIEALGTGFAVERDSAGLTRIALLEGRLQIISRLGARHQLEAPAGAVLAGESWQGPQALGERDRRALDLLDELSAAAAGQAGLVHLTSDPIAEVQSGQRSLGRTPLLALRAEGPWSVELRAAGHEPKQVELLVNHHSPLAMHLRLQPSRPPLRQAAEPRPDPDTVLAQVRRQMAARQLPQARAALDAYLEEHPADSRARFLLADALRLSGEGQAALGAYSWLVDHSQDERQVEAALYQSGLLQLKTLERPEQALGSFQRLRRQQPKGLLRQEVAFHLAECYLATSDFPRALRALRDYVRLYPRGTRVDEARRLVQTLEDKGWR